MAVIMDGRPSDGSFFELTRALLEARGVELASGTDAQERRRLLPEADVAIVLGRDSMTGEDVGTLRNAVGILCYSIGMDKVSTAATVAGIPVRNVPDYCTDEVSDHALTLLLAAERRLGSQLRDMADGGWQTAQQSPEIQRIHRLRGQTLAVIGAGRIGRLVARKARAFGFATLAVDPFLTADPDPGFPLRTLPEVLPVADAIVICAALSDASKRLIDHEALDRMKPGVILVNIARGGFIDEPALAAAMRDGRVAVAALDVRDPEPPDPASDVLAGLPNLIATPHTAANSIEGLEDLHRKAAATVIELLEAGGRLPATAETDH
jgi:D-3-phosphoglycerate dehydrogenase